MLRRLTKKRTERRARERTDLTGLTPEEALLAKTYDILRQLPKLMRTLIALVLVTALLQLGSNIQLERRNGTLDNIERIVKYFEALSKAEPEDDQPTGAEFNVLVLEGLRKIDAICQLIECDKTEEP